MAEHHEYTSAKGNHGYQRLVERILAAIADSPEDEVLSALSLVLIKCALQFKRQDGTVGRPSEVKDLVATLTAGMIDEASAEQYPDIYYRDGQIGVVAIPNGATLLVKDLIPRILRASLEGTSEGGDREHEERAQACFFVACSHLAFITDSKHRNTVISNLSDAARSCVESSQEVLDEVRQQPTRMIRARTR
jgi:hypothetical protein